MGGTFTDLQLEVLDLLSNGPSSFAALFRYCATADGVATPTPTLLLREVVRLAESGLVRLHLLGPDRGFRAAGVDDIRAVEFPYENWLGHRDPASIVVDEVSVDEVGLWCRLSEAGRQAWEALPRR